MPIRYEIEPGTLHFHFEGDGDFEETLRVVGDGLVLAGDAVRARAAQPFDLLFDKRASSENRSAEQLRRMADLVGDHTAALSRRAAIVVGDAFHFGLGRMFAAFADARGIEVQVFYSRDDAERWLAGAPAGGEV